MASSLIMGAVIILYGTRFPTTGHGAHVSDRHISKTGLQIFFKFSGIVGDIEGTHPPKIGENLLWGFCPPDPQRKNFGTPQRHNRPPQAAGFWRKRYPLTIPTLVSIPTSLGQTPEFWEIFEILGGTKTGGRAPGKRRDGFPV